MSVSTRNHNIMMGGTTTSHRYNRLESKRYLDETRFVRPVRKFFGYLNSGDFIDHLLMTIMMGGCVVLIICLILMMLDLAGVF